MEMRNCGKSFQKAAIAAAHATWFALPVSALMSKTKFFLV
jgi:hypothetical protein